MGRRVEVAWEKCEDEAAQAGQVAIDAQDDVDRIKTEFAEIRRSQVGVMNSWEIAEIIQRELAEGRMVAMLQVGPRLP